MNKIRVLDKHNLEKFIQKKDEGFILSALNLFMLGFLKRNKAFPKHAYFWCDGIFGVLFLRLKGYSTPKFPGVNLLKQLISYHQGHDVSILGSMTKAGLILLESEKLTIVEHYPLPDLIEEDLGSINCQISTKVVFITLPSPKQELLALNLAKKYHNLNIYCIGGALNMLAHPELDCPSFLRRCGLEFLFRLRSDTKRRTLRLFLSLFRAVSNFNYLNCLIACIEK
jgi:UDP-N-acetyl-D-mannosaminuronic acid transferase (WecB/TagA/CpsF family)